MTDFADWIGRSRIGTDVLEPARSNALVTALGGEGAAATGDPLPLLHHWLYFWDVMPPAGIGPDGHPAKGGFLPPVPLPRRMWAGGRLAFHAPLRLGEEVTRTSTITAIEAKDGRSGRLVFVTLRHELAGEAGLAVIEEKDLVYREPSPGAVPLPQAAGAPDVPWCETIAPDPVLLFRYSALTMNGHRIHYDRPYATTQEGYPELVVHGPLQATLLIDVAQRRLDAPVTGFDFRGASPAFCGLPLHICGEAEGTGARLWTQQGDARAMLATVRTG